MLDDLKKILEDAAIKYSEADENTLIVKKKGVSNGGKITLQLMLQIANHKVTGTLTGLGKELHGVPAQQAIDGYRNRIIVFREAFTD